jgi:hypothetical protein
MHADRLRAKLDAAFHAPSLTHGRGCVLKADHPVLLSPLLVEAAETPDERWGVMREGVCSSIARSRLNTRC